MDDERSIDLKKEYFFNADFDLSLREQMRLTPDQRRNVRDLSLLAWPLATNGDTVLAYRDFPDSFLEYLGQHGFECPSVTQLPDMDPEAQLHPFGWNQEASTLNIRHQRPTTHPPLSTVRNVNGRPFSAGIARDLLQDQTTIGVADSISQFEDMLLAMPDATEVVVKARHGNAALANRRLVVGAVGRGDRLWLERSFESNPDVVLEYWRRREIDLCTSFHVDRHGRVAGLSFHEAVNTADGAYIGSIFDPDEARVRPWRGQLEESARVVGRRLGEAGYFGPVCLDAFVWRDESELRLCPLVDLNARLHVSVAFQHLWRSLPANRVAYWRFYSRRKIDVPDTAVAFDGLMGRDGFHSSTLRGVLLTMPPSWGDGSAPAKISLMFVGHSRDEVCAMDARFRRRFENRRSL